VLRRPPDRARSRRPGHPPQGRGRERRAPGRGRMTEGDRPAPPVDLMPESALSVLMGVVGEAYRPGEGCRRSAGDR
jgi:hypothetical protein